MPTFKAPVRDINFVLNEVLIVGQLAEYERYADATPDIVEGVVDEAAKLIENQIAPLNQAGDTQGARFDNGEVHMVDGFTEAYQAYAENGWIGLSADPEYGGQGLPFVLSKAVEDILCAGNVAFALYPGLTQGCYEGLEANASDDIKATYLPKLANGEWAGTMCMTEPQAGSDVGAVKTKAEPQDDGSYLLSGGKIFISSGQHTMTDNIVHFVLARLPDSPPGVKGLTTFVVPKYLVNDDGSLGDDNGVRCVSIEEKMGLHGSCTCSLQFENARGWIVGQPNQGIQNMFVMMNKARIMVGMQGLGQCELATQTAIRYAQERVQGKPMTGGEDVTIMAHPDVRRMLLTMKAVTEGARVMAYETSLNEDLAVAHPDAEVREAASDWVELGTPLTKAFCTDMAVELGSLAIQVYGGHGYIKEHGVEQIMRDAKILCLYEGTNGIQAMDLARRKIKMKGGKLPQRFFDKVDAELAAHGDDAPEVAAALREAVAALKEGTAWMQAQLKDNPDAAGAGAVPYQRAFALTWVGMNWLRMAAKAKALPDDAFKQGKLATARFFAAALLPEVASLCRSIQRDAGLTMDLPAEAFLAA